MSDDPLAFETDPPAGPEAPDLEAFLQNAMPRRSWAAWGGFVLALILLAPWVALTFRKFQGQPGLITGGLVGFGGGVLAMVLGVVGIFRTRKRRRRGRAVAIAAIPLGLAGGFLQLAVGLLGHHVLAVRAQGDLAVKILRVPSDEIDARAAAWRTDLGSARFQANVSTEQFAGWLREVLAKHGQLQSATMSRKSAFQTERRATKYRLVGQFVNGSAPIEMIMGYDGGSITPRIDDIRVDGSSPLNGKPPDS